MENKSLCFSVRIFLGQGECQCQCVEVSQTKWEVEEVEDKLGAMVLQVDLPAGRLSCR